MSAPIKRRDGGYYVLKRKELFLDWTPEEVGRLIDAMPPEWQKFWTEVAVVSPNLIKIPISSFPDPFPMKLPQPFVDAWFAKHDMGYYSTGAIARACISNPNLMKVALKYKKSTVK